MHYFISDRREENYFLLSKQQIHQLDKVLRIKTNEFFIIIFEGKHYKCLFKNNKAIIYEELKTNNEATIKVNLSFGLLKGKKNELVIQKAIEIGVAKIIILVMERSIANISKTKVERWNKIIKEAVEQSQRNFIPELVILDDINKIQNYMLVQNIVAFELAKKTQLKPKQNTTIIIGPEGGITSKELGIFQNLGFKTTKLTKSILRAETASIYCLSKLL